MDSPKHDLDFYEYGDEMLAQMIPLTNIFVPLGWKTMARNAERPRNNYQFDNIDDHTWYRDVVAGNDYGFATLSSNLGSEASAWLRTLDLPGRTRFSLYNHSLYVRVFSSQYITSRACGEEVRDNGKLAKISNLIHKVLRHSTYHSTRSVCNRYQIG